MRALAVIALVAIMAGGDCIPATALDLGAPRRAVNKLLGRDSAPPSPEAPGIRARAQGSATSRSSAASPAVAAGRGTESEPGALSAADSIMVDEILLAPEPYIYRNLGTRDPFVSLVSESGEEEGGLSEEVYVRGILWGEHDRFALVETSGGTSKILRAGDHFSNFTVTRIEPDAVVIFTSAYGTGRTQRLPLVEWKGSQNARGER